MKSILATFAVVLFTASVAFANCGMDHGKAAGCPMHAEKNTTLTEASKALSGTNPELSAKLSEMAANCCGEHKH